MKLIIKLVFLLLFITPTIAQIDTNKCYVKNNFGFSVNILQFTDSLFIQQSYNKSTLYLNKTFGKAKNTILNGSHLGVKFVDISEVNNILAIVDYNGTIKILNYKNNKVLKEIKPKSKTTAIILTNEKLILGFENGEINIYSLNGKDVYKNKIHEASIADIKYYGNKLVSICQDGKLKILELKEKLEIIKEVGLKKTLTKLEVSPNNKKLAIGTFNGEILILETKTLKILKTYTHHKNIITQLKFFDNIRLLSSSFDRKINITNIDTDNYKNLINVKYYIMNFDINKSKFIYSLRDGTMNYLNLKCYRNKGFLSLIQNFK